MPMLERFLGSNCPAIDIVPVSHLTEEDLLFRLDTVFSTPSWIMSWPVPDDAARRPVLLQVTSRDLLERIVRWNAPVTAISQPNVSSVVGNTKDCTCLARKVVPAVPSTVLRNMAFEPALPSDKRLLPGSLKYGYYTKVMLSFKPLF